MTPMRRRFILLNIALLAATVSLVLFLYVFSGRVREQALMQQFPLTAATEASTPPPDTAPNAGADSVLRVAVASIVSPENSLARYEDFAAYLGAQLGMTGKVLFRSRYHEVNNLVKNRECDLAFVCSYPFILGEREFGMKAIAAPLVGGQMTYHALFIVPARSPARSLLDLKGKTFASADNLSNTGWFYPARWLRRHGQDPYRFFGERMITGGHDRSIRAVASGYVDGASVHSLVYEQAPEDVRSRTRVIDSSPPFGMPPLCINPAMSAELQERLRQALFHMHETSEGRRILAAFKFDRFEAPHQDLYDPLRELVRESPTP